MSEVRISCSYCGQPFHIEHLVDQDDGTLLCAGCIQRRTAAAQWEKSHPHLASLSPTGFASDGIAQVKSGDTVIYHFADGDSEAKVIRFTGIGANLDVNGTLIRDARRGSNVGQWDAIPPRRSVVSEE